MAKSRTTTKKNLKPKKAPKTEAAPAPREYLYSVFLSVRGTVVSDWVVVGTSPHTDPRYQELAEAAKNKDMVLTFHRATPKPISGIYGDLAELIDSQADPEEEKEDEERTDLFDLAQGAFIDEDEDSLLEVDDDAPDNGDDDD